MAQEKPLLQPHPCSNPQCSNLVQSRRPSATGDHWCRERACQAMKQRQRRAAAKSAGVYQMTIEDERLLLVTRALHSSRQSCPTCDLEDGVPGFLHRAAAGSLTVCDGLGGAGRAAGARWIDAIHPERAKA